MEAKKTIKDFKGKTIRTLDSCSVEELRNLSVYMKLHSITDVSKISKELLIEELYKKCFSQASLLKLKGHELLRYADIIGAKVNKSDKKDVLVEKVKLCISKKL